MGSKESVGASSTKSKKHLSMKDIKIVIAASKPKNENKDLKKIFATNRSQGKVSSLRFRCHQSHPSTCHKRTRQHKKIWCAEFVIHG